MKFQIFCLIWAILLFILPHETEISAISAIEPFYCAAPDVQALKLPFCCSSCSSCFFYQNDSDFVRLLGYRFENNFYADDDIRDMYSGQEYRKLMHPAKEIGLFS